MRYTRPDPFDMIESLSLEEKKSLLGYLSDSIRKMEASATKMTYLEERWMEIKRLMKSLDYEPYIDDQVEIEEIWDICEDLIKSGKIQDTSWAIRRAILQEIIEGEYFDEYGVFDPMKQLFSALCISKKERITSADMCFEFGSGYMKKDGAKVYLECGLPEKYYDYLETCLSRDGKLYEELIMYYKDRDYEKALEIAELAMKKCKENLTETVIFLLQDAESKQDSAKYTRLMKSAKLRYAINYQEVLERMENQPGPDAGQGREISENIVGRGRFPGCCPGRMNRRQEWKYTKP